MIDSALRYLAKGFSIIPLRARDKRPAISSWKRYQTKAATEATVRRWFSEEDRNIGIVTGAVSGLVVVDADSHEAAEWVEANLPPTPAGVFTGRGAHYYFRHPNGGEAVQCGAGVLAEGVDLKGDGGYVVAPPSIHPSGAEYRWVGDDDGWDLEGLPVFRPRPPDPPPDRGESRLEERANKVAQTALAAVFEASEGHRNDALNRAAFTLGGLVPRHLSRAAAESMLWGAGTAVGLGAREVAATIKSGLDSGEASPLDLEGDEGPWKASSGPVGAETPRGASEGEGEAEAAPIRVYSLSELEEEFPTLREPLIEGLLRRGETANVIAPSKMGKSWLVASLAYALADGTYWLGWPCHESSVLILDNELHHETLQDRLRRVREALGASVTADIRVCPLRGHLRDLQGIGELLRANPADVIILDAFYRFIPAESNENDNAAMAGLYNWLDRYARDLGCAFIVVHHTSKGSQAGKQVTDVGSGAGSMARATDTHIVLRHHEVRDAVVFDAAVRSWPPVEPKCLRWAHPMWEEAPELDPAHLWAAGTERLEEGRRDVEWTAERVAEELVDPDSPRTLARIRAAARGRGLKKTLLTDLLEEAEALGLIRLEGTRPKSWVREEGR